MSEFTWYPRLAADGDGSGLVSQAGTLLLVRTAEKIGLVKGLSQALAPWRKPLATHNPGKIVLDLAIAVAAGADCAADVSVLRTQPGMFGSVASDPTVSRLVSTLAADAPKALSAIAKARATARAAAWKRAGEHAPDHGINTENPLIVDLDATLLDAHSEKENAAPTYKKGFGFHPLCAFIDHGPTAPANQPRSCCARVTLVRTPPPTTSLCWPRPYPSCRGTRHGGWVERCWYAPTLVAAPTNS